MNPHRFFMFLGQAESFFLEFVFGGDRAPGLLDRIMDAGLRLVPEELWILVRNMAVVAARLHARSIGEVHALLVFLRDPCHRVARAAAEFVGAGRSHHDLGGDHPSRTHDYSDYDERQHRPPGAGRGEPRPGTSRGTARARVYIRLSRHGLLPPVIASLDTSHREDPFDERFHVVVAGLYRRMA